MSPQFDQGLQDALDAPDPELDSDQFVEAVSEALHSDVETPEVEDTPREETDQEGTEADTEEPQDAPEDAPPSFVDIGGVQIPNDKAEAVANFYAWSQSPEGQPWVQALSEAMEKGVDPRAIFAPQEAPQDAVVTRPPPDQVVEPEYFEPETAYKTLQQRVEDLATVVETREAQARAANEAQISFLVDSVREEFATAHQLNPEEARRLVQHMDQTTVLAGYRVDPTTGQARDARSTLLAAMDAAYWAHPDLREKEVARLQADQKDRAKKDRKLAAVGGTSGSVPHRAEPNTPEERDAQAVEIIANAMGMKA